MMNRSAKDGARSSPHYRGEGVLIHPSYQGVCGWHGTEEQRVTSGELVRFPGGTCAAKGHQRDYAYYRCVGTDAYSFGGHRICDILQVRTDRLDDLVRQQVVELLSQARRNPQG